MNVHNKSSLKEIRRALRKDATEAEIILWKFIRAGRLRGRKFKRQHSIGNYIVDFYCAQHRIIIELDGAVHNNIGQKEKDDHRDLNLKDMDYVVLRFTNDQVINGITAVINTIESYF